MLLYIICYNDNKLFSIHSCLIKREGASEGTVGSLDSLELYNFNEKISGTPKILKKKWGHFLKLDILKMSVFQNAKNKFSKKNEKSIFTQGCFKYQKNTPKFVTIKFYSFFEKGF